MTPAPDLVYYPDSRPGITRRRHGRGFSYRAPDGTRIEARAMLKRIRSLAVPPAYEDVWISPREKGHLQATGRDARARKQYRYHPDWTEYRATRKFGHLAEFGRVLPSIRRRLARDLRGEAGDQAFALAAIVTMIDRLSMRVGNRDYAAENRTYGATTLRSAHLSLDDDGLALSYRGKGGARIRREVKDRRLARLLGRLDDLPGAELATWVDDDGRARAVTSEEVNAWLAGFTGNSALTAKTFRTWNGSVAALEAALADEEVTIKAMAEAASERLANTPAIARSSYIHPQVIALTEDRGPLAAEVAEVRGLRQAEARLLSLIEA